MQSRLKVKICWSESIGGKVVLLAGAMTKCYLPSFQIQISQTVLDQFDEMATEIFADCKQRFETRLNSENLLCAVKHLEEIANLLLITRVVSRNGLSVVCELLSNEN